MTQKILTITLQKRVGIYSHPFFIIGAILFLHLSHFSLAGFYFDKKNEATYQDILKLKIEKAEKQLESYAISDPTNGINIYLKNYTDIIRIFVSEDKKLYEKLSPNEDIRIRKISNLEKNSPYYLFTQAEIKLQWAFIKLKFGEEVNAMWNLRLAYKLLKENEKLFPDFIPNKKSLGLLNILLGSVPSDYLWVVNLVGMKGDVETGIKQLKEVENSNDMFRLEATILRILIEQYILETEGLERVSTMNDLYYKNRDNLLIHFIYSSLLMKNNRSEAALNILLERPTSKEYIAFPFLKYMIAEVYLHQGKFSTSRAYYLKFLEGYQGGNFIKDTYYKILLSWWLENNESNARIYFQKIIDNGQTVLDSDKHAQKFAEKKELPNKEIMKVRLYTDGGYFEKAHEVLKELSLNKFTEKKDKVEYIYRTARLFHKTSDLNNAIEYYQKTIELSTGEVYYFAPNSCLQLGYIYKNKGNKTEAEAYFKKAMSYKGHEYKNSIDNKAKAALNAMHKE